MGPRLPASARLDFRIGRLEMAYETRHYHTAPCRLAVYMASADTTTIRVSTETRDRLNALAIRRGEPAGEVVAKLVNAADEEAMLAEIAIGFEKLAGDPEACSAYRAESEEIESGFESSAPGW